MKKFVILAGLMAVALLLGLAGTAGRSDTAQAKPEEVLTFSPKVCISLTSTVLEGDWNDDGDYTAADPTLAVAACANGGLGADPGAPAPLARGLGGAGCAATGGGGAANTRG